jgi:hypothetical protein
MQGCLYITPKNTHFDRTNLRLNIELANFCAKKINIFFSQANFVGTNNAQVINYANFDCQ